MAAEVVAEVHEREFSHGEMVADGIVHAVGLVAATGGAGALIAAAVLRGESVVSVAVYVLGLITMLSASAAYNLGDSLPVHELLRRIDYAAIFVMIAGTYTPFTVKVLSGGWAVGLTAAVWGIALLGILVKTVIAPYGMQTVTTLLYIAFGWIGAIAAHPFLSTLSPQVLRLVLAGGAVYTVGAIVFSLDRLPYRRAIWHGFVIAGAAIHFCAIFMLVAASA